MKTCTCSKILEYINEHKQTRAHDLVDFLSLSNVAVHKHLKRLVDIGEIKKVGSPPLVFYIPTFKS